MKPVLTTREQNLIIAGAALVFCVVFIVYLIIPFWQSYSLVKNDLDNETASLQKLQKKKAGAAKQDIEKIGNEVKQMRKQIPSAANTAELVFYLNQAAGKTGVSLDGFEVLPGNKNRNKDQDQEQDVKSLDARVKITGTYGQIRNFLAQTEGLTRLTHNLALTIAESRTIPGKLESTVEFKAFFESNSTRQDYVSDVPKSLTGRTTPFRF